MEGLLKKGGDYDRRFIKVRRPTIVTGGELTLPMLDLKYNPIGKFYEAPLQMKANGGIFMIDDFGRQQMRPMDLLNRWIVPLEKKYDYLTTITGTKVEVPFDVLLIFSTNLDPTQLADEAFLRRIKFKIEIRDPDEVQYRQIWELVCSNKRIEYDPSGIDYLIDKWYRPHEPAVPHVPAAGPARADALDRQVQHGAGDVQPGPDRRRLPYVLHQPAPEAGTSGPRSGWTN